MRQTLILVLWVGLCGLGLQWVGCQESKKTEPPPTRPPAPRVERVTYSETRTPCKDFHPERKAYFGDLHVHGAYSFDAWAYRSRMKPADIYRFAKGQKQETAPFDDNGKGRPMQLERPLDFAAVTEHSEFLGEVALCSTPGSKMYDNEVCSRYRVGDDDAVTIFGILLTMQPNRMVDLCGDDGKGCLSLAQKRWQELIKAAKEAYDRTEDCEFVSFVGYEYTTTPGVSNVHRNVIFRNESVPPLPVSFYEQPTPYGLWRALKSQCIDGIKGCDVLTIGHNSNLSNGKMYALSYSGKTDDVSKQKEDAMLRARMEPLIEMMQHKGSMECRNGLSNQGGVDDPYCSFEKLREDSKVSDCGDSGTGQFGIRRLGCVSWLDFTRGILKVGLRELGRIGANPYRLGVIGATDTHNGIAGYTDEHRFKGHIGVVDDTPTKLLGKGNATHDALINNPGGLAVVWAKERSRDAIFNAMLRRETYATSGPRITVRFFGGWAYPAGMCDEENLAKIGYEKGVPMGGQLTKPTEGAKAPKFLLMAQQDKGTSSMTGTPLQQIQIIKGWVDKDGKVYEKVYTVGGKADNGASVDTNTCKRSGVGFERLCTLWTDPDFDAARPAFYYARVLENPSCRWSTYVCNSLPADKQPDVCKEGAKVPKVIQERAWTSSIWYTP